MWFRRNQIAQNFLNFLGKGTEVLGDLHVDGNFKLDGIIHGVVEVIGDLEVLQDALIEGPEVRAHNITLYGVIKARVIAEGRLTLSNTARLEGDVTASSLDIQPGAFYSGYISTTSSDEKILPGTGKLPELMSRERESLS
ncbi:MAG: polymer-forming cytoskeletal protein [Leptolyngbyaceae cyanobacterium SL_7_1]|nr:polymer-forming cytoskeletal protein [Leptolyngbyaceae cyanobacterium SL_7_1]